MDIFELRSLFATFETLKSVEFPVHAVVRNLDWKQFNSNALLFSNYNVVTLRLHNVKNGQFKAEEIITF